MQKGIPINLKTKDNKVLVESFFLPDDNNIDELKRFTIHFEIFSISLYKAFPEYFIPYLFDRKGFYTFLKVCENFDIALPPFPPKNNWVKRIWYYFDLCVSLNEFRKYVKLSPSEFVAFIYDFGPKSLLDVNKAELPSPTKAWFIGAGEWDYDFLDGADDKSRETWGAGNDRIKAGDIIVMYCTLPRKSIHSIWRATSDSFINPFAYYFHVVDVGFPIKTNPIGFQTLLSNPVFKENSTVKARMQGLNGKPLNQTEYQELLHLINEAGIDITGFPQLPAYNHSNENIQDERDVEIELVEPLLTRLGFKEKDWMRQMPIRMGRGIRFYPDYSINYNAKRGEETAQIIMEAKYEILSDRQLEEAYLQAKSYAIRLQCKLFIVVDKNCLYLFEPQKNIYELNSRNQYTWKNLDNPDIFHILKEKMTR